MTDFFHALLDRAEGTATGLEPRKASRFEHDAGANQDVSDFPLPSAEIPQSAAAAQRAPTAPVLAPAPWTPPPASAPLTRPAIESSPTPAVARSDAPTAREILQPDLPTSFAPTPPSPQVPIPNLPTAAIPLPPDPPSIEEGLRPSAVIERTLIERIVPTEAASLSSHLTSASAAVPPMPPPGPLANPFSPALVVAEPEPAPSAPVPPPVIEISIGTIEFRAAPLPSPAAAAAPRPAGRDTQRLPSLEDYLKTRRSIRS